jgi:hypothetical protein
MDKNENYRCGQTRTETNERTGPNDGRVCPLGVHRCRIGYENRRGRVGINDLAGQVPPWVPSGADKEAGARVCVRKGLRGYVRACSPSDTPTEICVEHLDLAGLPQSYSQADDTSGPKDESQGDSAPIGDRGKRRAEHVTAVWLLHR